MRVGLVLEQALAPVPGGTSRYALELAGALAADDSLSVSGWTAWHRETSGARVRGVHGPYRLPLPRRPLTAAWERGVGPVPHGIDLVHAPTLLMPPRGRRALVVTIHDAVPWTHPETLTPRGVRWHRSMAERAVAQADAIVVPSAATAASLARHLPLRRHPEVIPLGVTSLPVPADAERRARALELPVGGYVLSLATVEPRKGLDVLMHALAQPSMSDLSLVLVGAHGWGSLDPMRLATEAGLVPGRLRVLGRVGDEDLAVAMAGATALAVPSRAEGFGLPVLEGMAAGVPVVISDDAALREVGGDAVVRSETGNPSALAEALARVATDGDMRARLVQAGRERVRSYTWAECAERTARLYRQVA